MPGKAAGGSGSTSNQSGSNPSCLGSATMQYLDLGGFLICICFCHYFLPAFSNSFSLKPQAGSSFIYLYRKESGNIIIQMVLRIIKSLTFSC